MDGTNKDSAPKTGQNDDVSSLEEQSSVSVSSTNDNNGSGGNVKDETDSLEGSDPGAEEGLIHTPDGQEAPTTHTPLPVSHGRLERVARHFNIYLLLFAFLLILAIVSGTIFYLKANEQANNATKSSSQSLSQSALSQLANSDVTVGGPQYTLNVQSNAVFSGSVLVHSNLQIAGTLQVGSDAANNGLRVTGNSTFDDVQIDKSLALSGNGSVQGQFNIQGNLGVNGTASFSGDVSAPQLTVGTLILTGNANFTHHITAGGSTPTRTYGTALGNGGSASVSGSDSAGSISINTGASPPAGCFVTVTFSSAFNSTPHIVVTPVGSSAAGIEYYITRSTTNFSLCTASAPPSSASFGFDYIAFD
jgi:cytoskeletal protein CcmA (bactofilin family)